MICASELPKGWGMRGTKRLNGAD